MKEPDKPTTKSRILQGHRGKLYCLAISPDNKRLASGGEDGIRFWDLETDQEVHPPSGVVARGGTIFTVSYSPEGDKVISGNAEGLIQLWDVNTGKEIKSFTGHRGVVVSIRFFSDGKRFLSGGEDGTVRLWDVSADKERKKFGKGHVGRVHCVAVSPDGRGATSVGIDQALRVWDVASGREFSVHKVEHGVPYGVAFMPDSLRFWTCGEGGITKWKAGERFEQGTISFASVPVPFMDFSPDGRQAVFACNDLRIRLLQDTSSGLDVHFFDGHTEQITGIAFSPNGAFVVSCSFDKTIRVWEVPK